MVDQAGNVCHYKDQTAVTIAKLFVEEIVWSWGSMSFVVSSAFLSYLMTEICKLLGTNKINITAYHLQTNGLTEQFN